VWPSQYIGHNLPQTISSSSFHSEKIMKECNVHALESYYHTEILLHVVINLVWLSLTEKGDFLWPNKVWDSEAQRISIL